MYGAAPTRVLLRRSARCACMPCRSGVLVWLCSCYPDPIACSLCSYAGTVCHALLVLLSLCAAGAGQRRVRARFLCRQRCLASALGPLCDRLLRPQVRRRPQGRLDLVQQHRPASAEAGNASGAGRASAARAAAEAPPLAAQAPHARARHCAPQAGGALAGAAAARLAELQRGALAAARAGSTRAAALLQQGASSALEGARAGARSSARGAARLQRGAAAGARAAQAHVAAVRRAAGTTLEAVRAARVPEQAAVLARALAAKLGVGLRETGRQVHDAAHGLARHTDGAKVARAVGRAALGQYFV
jgi:hypothetical protein